MADEAAENVGGISVEIGANHARLPGDIAAADKVFEQARARWEAPIVLRAQAVQPAQQQVVRPAQAPSIAVGPGSSTRAQSAQAQTALQRAINAELSKTGEIYNSQTGEIESATKATHAQRQAVVAVQQQAAQSTALAIDTKPLQADLQAVLATMREIVAEAQKIASTPVAPPVAALAGGSANNPRRYVTSRRGGLTDEQRRAANYLNANPPPQSTFSGLPSVTNINSPGYKSNEEIERERATQSRRPQVVLPQRTAAPIDEIERQRRSIVRDYAEFGRSRGGATGLNDEDFARRAEQRILTSESRGVATGRTPRTTASGFGGQFLFGGPARQQAEASARVTEAEQRALNARRRLFDPQIFNNARAFRQATLEQVAADEGLVKATEKLRSLSGPATALRSLAAVTVAGAAFGIAMKAVDVAISTLGPALGDAIDQASGFGAVSNRVTQGLGQQTIAARGNIDAVLALTETQASLSASSADVVNSQIKLTSQVKAGAQAAAATGGLFRASLGANQQTPQGLLGGFGGIGGGPLFAQQLGGGPGLAETIKSIFGDNTRAGRQATGQSRGDILSQLIGGNSLSNPFNQPSGLQVIQGLTQPVPKGQEQADRLAQIAKDRTAAEGTFNEAAKRGAALLGATSTAVAHFGQITDDQATQIAASNLPQELKDLAKDSKEGLLDASGNLILAYQKATDALTQTGVGLSIPDLATVGRANLAQVQQQQRESAASLDAIRSQQAFASGPQVAAIQREQLDTLLRTLPATQALGNLAHPLLPTTTGLTGSVGGQQIAANPQEASRITSSLREANSLQAELNAGYKEGRQVIRDTYDPAVFKAGGAAAVTAFHAGLDAVEATGQRIAQIQAGISDEQAAYQTAQYNFQLQIARRTLSDIGGLTDHNFGAGESYLGVLERQNLALSRQGQLLSFALSQRQINFQTALAGFQAPGVTPEERQARIAEAKAEAAYAQKQLDIQKQSFKNQVKIVDISNLRQGADLAHQIALLVQGRKVTIDTAVAEKKLALLATKQDQNIAKVSAYFKTVDSLTAQGMANVNQLELAYGHAIVGITQQILGSFGVYIKGLDTILGGYNGYGNRSNPADSSASSGHASGGVFNTRGMTRLTNHDIVGEASGETVAILSHPRALGSGGGGVSVVVNFTGDIKAGDPGDLEKVTAAVIKGLGRQASLLGLRGVG